MSSETAQEGKAGSALKAWVRALEKTAPIAQHPTQTLPLLIDSLGERFGDAPALLSPGKVLTYRALAERSRRYASWAHRQGLSSGDVVCLMMPNCPEYLAIWLGITRVGAIVALLNTNLVGDSLAHAINVVAPKHVIVDATLVDAVADLKGRVSSSIQIWAHGENGRGLPRVDREVDGEAALNGTGTEYRLPTLADRALYIYTSGTTGLPKAVNVSHFRLMQWSHWFAGMMDTRPEDRIYNCLPMYHSVGGVTAIGAALVNGASVEIRERFSASHFWEDVVESRCTIFQYIGELCRYLVNTAPHPAEAQHRLRLACGNGLSADVWDTFQRRFHVPQILEFYAATEANFSLFNCEGKVGAIGKIPSFLRQRLSVALVKFDHDAQAPAAHRGRSLHPLFNQRSWRGDQSDSRRRNKRGRPLRRLCGQSRHRKKDPAQRVRKGRRVVPQRRFDAQGRERLLLLRRSHRRYVSVERRERIDRRGRRSSDILSGRS